MRLLKKLIIVVICLQVRYYFLTDFYEILWTFFRDMTHVKDLKKSIFVTIYDQ